MSAAEQFERTARAASDRAGVTAEIAIRIRTAVAVLPSSFAAIEKRHAATTWESKAGTRSRVELDRISRLTNDAHQLAIDLAKRLENLSDELDRQAVTARRAADDERDREAAEHAAAQSISVAS